MASRKEMKEAKKAAGLCLYPGCGNRSVAPPVFDYCKDHIPPHLVVARGKKGEGSGERPGSN
jgi:hypothetical protein